MNLELYIIHYFLLKVLLWQVKSLIVVIDNKWVLKLDKRQIPLKEKSGTSCKCATMIILSYTLKTESHGLLLTVIRQKRRIIK